MTRVVWKLYFYNVLTELYNVISNIESKRRDATFAKPRITFLNFWIYISSYCNFIRRFLNTLIFYFTEENNYVARESLFLKMFFPVSELFIIKLLLKNAIIIVNILAHLAYYKAKNIACYNCLRALLTVTRF